MKTGGGGGDEMVDTTMRTFSDYGYDIKKQLAIPDYYEDIR